MKTAKEIYNEWNNQKQEDIPSVLLDRSEVVGLCDEENVWAEIIGNEEVGFIGHYETSCRLDWRGREILGTENHFYTSASATFDEAVQNLRNKAFVELK